MKTFICDCHSLEHQVTFWHDNEDNDLYIMPHLITNDNVFKRIWTAIRYVFGYKSKYGDWDEIILSPESQVKLRKYLNEFDKK